MLVFRRFKPLLQEIKLMLKHSLPLRVSLIPIIYEYLTGFGAGVTMIIRCGTGLKL